LALNFPKERTLPIELIDPPGAFSSTKEWRDFLAQLETLPKSEAVLEAMKDARQELSRPERAKD
jgi:hypothetical protein